MKRTALVVDDSESIRMMVAFTLKQADFEVIQAGNGVEALERLNGHRPALVITDLNMPRMDGIELIRSLRALPEMRTTPILMLTTETQESKRQEGRSAGATGWVVKPFDPRKLLQVVAKVLP